MKELITEAEVSAIFAVSGEVVPSLTGLVPFLFGFPSAYALG
jgi:hypothetical protein